LVWIKHVSVFNDCNVIFYPLNMARMSSYRLFKQLNLHQPPMWQISKSNCRHHIIFQHEPLQLQNPESYDRQCTHFQLIESLLWQTSISICGQYQIDQSDWMKNVDIICCDTLCGHELMLSQWKHRCQILAVHIALFSHRNRIAGNILVHCTLYSHRNRKELWLDDGLF
jgi:hypothetical protein